MLEAHNLGGKLFAFIEQYLEENGMKVSGAPLWTPASSAVVKKSVYSV